MFRVVPVLLPVWTPITKHEGIRRRVFVTLLDVREGRYPPASCGRRAGGAQIFLVHQILAVMYIGSVSPNASHSLYHPV